MLRTAFRVPIKACSRPSPINYSFVRTIANYYRLFPETLKDGPPPKGKFDINTRELRKEYLRAQQAAHPDLANSRQEKPQVSSAELGSAYRTLCDPLLRSEHLLALNGINKLEEGNSVQDEEMLMDIMMIREEVAECENSNELRKLADENEVRLQKAIDDARTAFESNDLKAALRATIFMSYWSKLKKELVERLDAD